MAIELIDTLAPKNGGSFPMVKGEDVEVNGVRLPKALEDVVNNVQEASNTEIDNMFRD